MDHINSKGKKNHWEEIRRGIEQAMSTIAVIGAGELETGRQRGKNRKTAHKRVLLGSEALVMDRRFVQYALQLCARLGAGLEIVHMLEAAPSSEKDNSGLDRLRRSLGEKNIVYQPIVRSGCFEEEVEKYTRERRDILCVVLESAQKENGATGRKQYKFLKQISCPVVLFESQARTEE